MVLASIVGLFGVFSVAQQMDMSVVWKREQKKQQVESNWKKWGLIALSVGWTSVDSSPTELYLLLLRNSEEWGLFLGATWTYKLVQQVS